MSHTTLVWSRTFQEEQPHPRRRHVARRFLTLQLVMRTIHAGGPSGFTFPDYFNDESDYNDAQTSRESRVVPTSALAFGKI
jgi:hypothetical protein